MNSSAASQPTSPAAEQDHDSDNGDTQSNHESTLAGKNKVLVINRLVKNETGGFDWKSEVITDARVINAYLRHRKMIEKPPVYYFIT
jgi:transcription initiation factor TFIID subunit 1